VIDRFRIGPVATLCYWLWVGACVVVSIELLRRSLPTYLPFDWTQAHELDALSDWKAARLFRLSINPYTDFGLTMLGQSVMGHPPTTPFWFLPMLEFGKPLAAELTSLALWFLIAPHIYLCLKELSWPAPVATAMLMTSLVISAPWTLYHFRAVQLSEPIAFLYVLAWLFLRRGQDARAGICMGAAATMKLFPGLMIVMLLVARRWRGFFAATLVYGAIVAIMTWGYGVESWPLFFALQKPIGEAWIGSLQNSSLLGLTTQILYPFCDSVAYASKEASFITTACSLVLIAAATWYCRSNFRQALEANRRAIDLPFTLFALLSVFLNPWVWEHYYVLVIHPLLVLVTQFWLGFRVAYRRWSDGLLSPISFPAMTGITGFAFAALAFVPYALHREVFAISSYIEAWRQSSSSVFHAQAHFLQVLNFAPWIIAILLCFIALAIARRFNLVMK
jgi:hypothetical protein